jgi:4-hydroxybenzoate polyprenyltransferase
MEYSYEENPVIFPWNWEEIRNITIRRLHDIVDFLMFSSLYVAIAAGGMVYTSCFIQGIPPNGLILLVMALVSFSVYNLNRKTDEEEDAINHEQRFQFTKKFERPLFFAALCSYGIAIFIGALQGIWSLAVVMIPLISGILYSVPFLPATWQYRRLKEIPVMKNLVVATAWALPLSLIPVLFSSSLPGMSTAVALLFFLNYVFIASILPDIRDREGDALTGVRTIPVTIGVKRTKMLLIGVNTVVGSIVIALAIRQLPLTVSALLIAALLYIQFCIWSSGRLIRTDIICDFLSDGQFILFGGGILAISTLCRMIG